MKGKLFFKHFRTEKSGSITVCAAFENGPSFLMGVAFCSPKEKNFSKKIGRYIAEGRMKSFLNKRQATFGRGWNVVTKEARENGHYMDQIKRLLPEIKGPQWYPEFLEELSRDYSRNLYVR